MKVVIALNGENSLSKSHFGDAESFMVLEITQENSEVTATFDNIHKKADETGEHGSKMKRRSVLSLFGKDVNLIIANRKSPNFDRISRETCIIPVVSHLTEVDDIVKHIQTNYNHFTKLIADRKNDVEVGVVGI